MYIEYAHMMSSEEDCLYESVPNYYLLRMAEIRKKENAKIVKEFNKNQRRIFIEYIMLLSQVAFKYNLPKEIIVVISYFFPSGNNAKKSTLEISSTICNQSFFYLTIKERTKKCSSIKEYYEKHSYESKAEYEIVRNIFHLPKKCCCVIM